MDSPSKKKIKLDSDNNKNTLQTISLENIKLPLGFRFKPKDSSLITLYLIRKILNNRPLPTNAIKDIVFYDFDPDQLPIGEFSGYCRHNEAYFFTEVVPGRTTKSGGLWKVHGPYVPIMSGDVVIGFKKYFVFYSAGEEKTNWNMYEYRLNPRLIRADSPNELLIRKIDYLVICKVRYREDDENLSTDDDDTTSCSSDDENETEDNETTSRLQSDDDQ
ncbi:hypothetical protein LWI28_012418 [Acer negundo]|uniref:NAC domain-containing protein n=1 Tax=Acer negundo TaxID=4023 RepID=A0AAD5JB49_ACENE|nr:hypothetical protein LWI28_012418 [Acer negundo]KAK4854207.1 hypothetical protein QYF36_020492 [Acer negundo]